MPDNLSEVIIDLIIVLILVFSIYRGFKNGFIKEFMRFFGTYVSLIVAVRYMSNLAAILSGAIEDLSQPVVTIISFLLIFVPLMLFFRYLTIKLKVISKFSITLGSLDRLAGITLGLLKGAIVVCLCTFVISLTGLSKILRKEINSSMLYKPMLEQVLPLIYKSAQVFLWKNKPFKLELKETLDKGLVNVIDRRARDILNT